MNFEEWLERARRFLRRMKALPGKVSISDSIEPPKQDEDSITWLQSPDNRLPREIKDFLRSGSSRAYLSWHWTPPESLIEDLQRIWPEKAELTGGGDLCEQARYSLFETSRDVLENLGDLMAEAREAVAELFDPDHQALIPKPDESSGMASFFGKDDEGRAKGLVSILIFPDEARLSLDTNRAAGTPFPVVYTKAEDFDHPIPISASFQQFLKDWESLCYLTPDPETLNPWLTGPGGMLQVDAPQTKFLHRLFEKAASKSPSGQSSRGDSKYENYSDRIQNFVRNFMKGPGERGCTIKVDPPASEAELDERFAGHSYQIPEALRCFYGEASGNFTCRYTWRPDPRTLARIEAIIPHQYTLWGGLDLVAWDELESEPGYYCYWEEDEEDCCAMGRLAIPVWKLTVPLIHLGNGDIIGLYVGKEGNQEKIVLLYHDAPEDSVMMVANSFDEFLEGLERQCYLGAEISLLMNKEDEIPPLQHRPEHLAQLRALLLDLES